MKWITPQAVEMIHEEVIRTTGGLGGIHDRNLRNVSIDLRHFFREISVEPLGPW